MKIQNDPNGTITGEIILRDGVIVSCEKCGSEILPQEVNLRFWFVPVDCDSHLRLLLKCPKCKAYEEALIGFQPGGDD